MAIEETNHSLDTDTRKSPREYPVRVSGELEAHYDAFYNENVLEWRRLGAKYKVQNLVAMCAEVPHVTVLDIGAGNGAVAAELVRIGFSKSIHCVEISESALKFLRQRSCAKIVSSQAFDGMHIPFPDKYFDLAYSSHVLEHVEHERAFLVEAARVAKCLFIEVPLEDSFRSSPHFVPTDVGHINFYNRKTIRKLIESSGIKVLEQRLFDTPYEVLAYRGQLKGSTKLVIRRSTGALGTSFASRIFTYHCGLLCRT